MAVFSVQLDATELNSGGVCIVDVSTTGSDEVCFGVQFKGEELASFALSVDEAKQLRDLLNFKLK